ncbi:MAG TPA: GNAT family N-acetyltransferase [Allosphingosinicella sp.]|nr:GNAT family N-acetyltransferase [Allosphingosinicella sp.]
MFARTERLLLRPGWAEDAPALAKAIGEEAIVRNLASAPWPYDLEHARAFLATERRADEAVFLIFRRTRGAPQLIGTIGIGDLPSGGKELGYWIGRPHWGLGYATEAARAVVEIAREALRLETLSASHFLDNPASGRVLEKLGFRPTGEIARRYSCGRGAEAPCKLSELNLRRGERPVPHKEVELAA